MFREDFDPVNPEELGRHVSLHTLTRNLHRSLVGDRAAELLKNVPALPRRGGVLVTPSWTWRFPRIDVGHKGYNSDGERVLLPVRVTWDTSPVVVLERDEIFETGFAYSGMGVSGSGVSSITYTTEDVHANDTNEVPDSLSVKIQYKGKVVEELERLVADGQQAQWDIMAQLMPFVETAVEATHRYVSAEVSPNGQPVLDTTGREHIVTTLMYGNDESGQSMILNLLDRCKQPGTFLKVDPWMFMRRAISSAAESAIRRSIQDPHIGRKIRRVAEEIGTTDVDIVVDEYNKRFPKDRLARRRAEKALSAGSDVMAVWVGLPELVPVEERTGQS